MTSRDRLIKKNKLEGMEIDRRITAKHKYGDEVAILRKTVHALVHGLPIPTEFETYYAEAEAIKAEVKAN
jgi:pseudouridine-5'-phosphate glycosidase